MVRLSREKLSKAMRDPIAAFRFLESRWRGRLLASRYRRSRRLRIGAGIVVRGRYVFAGPGRVTVGDGVCLDGRTHAITFCTYAERAVITIGRSTFLNGTRFGCADRITIGDRCILADCRILDTNFHSIYPEKRDESSFIKIRAVDIGDDCWIGPGAFLLPGTKLGAGCTVAAGAVVMGRFPSRSVVAGNPASIIMTVGEPKPYLRPTER